MSRIEIFKTNVKSNKKANFIVAFLQKEFPNCKINFDLEDCDNILRVEGAKVKTNTIINYLGVFGYECIELY